MAAKEALLHHVKHNTINLLRYFGFENQADIDNAELGEGFRQFMINTNKLLDEPGPWDFQSLVNPNSIEWYFPIVANGKIKTLISVRFSDGKWRFAEIGRARLAIELSNINTRWPATSGYHSRYIFMLGSVHTFIELSMGGKIIGIIDLFNLSNTPGRAVGEFRPEDLRDPQEILKELRYQLKKDREYLQQHMEPVKQMKFYKPGEWWLLQLKSVKQIDNK
jgi:hypothetical protein